MIGDIVGVVNRCAIILLTVFTLAGCGDGTDVATPAAPPSPLPVAAPRAPSQEPPKSAAAITSPTLIVFSRDNCLPCEIMAPWVKEVAALYDGRLTVVEANLDRREMRPLGRARRIRSVPTQVYLDAAGQEVFRHQGLATKEEMVSVISKHGLLGP